MQHRKAPLPWCSTHCHAGCAAQQQQGAQACEGILHRGTYPGSALRSTEKLQWVSWMYA